ncbi:hypothetical protein C9374_011695 [Naegleria lovaniensis]|uniref:Uncharacterized protein n=1 Tax=Naegleria lovaniensis TaxID=51637 RepID=A0AA88GE67_NAELO|nr:uncharacterized protein C9374_011695 [Naegleria lovaniensis]KAG2373810.1 hypothetical protein C9374_011695 [Naegleria lovaniensis]
MSDEQRTRIILLDHHHPLLLFPNHDEINNIAHNNTTHHKNLDYEFNEHHHFIHHLYCQLQHKMKNIKQRKYGFSITNSPLIHKINFKTWNRALIHSENSFDPTSVCISHSFQIILVSDYRHSRVEVFDLISKNWKFGVDLWPDGFPTQMCVQENDEQYNQALIIACNSCIYKYDLKRFLSCCDIVSSQQTNALVNACIWENRDCDWVQGMAISYTEKQLYACDFIRGDLVLLDLQTGMFIRKIPMTDAFAVAFAENDQLLIVVKAGSCCVEIFRKENNLEWKLIKTIGGMGKEKFKFPSSVIADRFSRIIIVADRDNKRIQIFSLDSFEFVTSMGDGREELEFEYFPYSIGLNELNGELIVVEQQY